MINWIEIERIMMDYMYYGNTFRQFMEMKYEICTELAEDELRTFWREVRDYVGSGRATSPARQKLYKEGRL